MKIQCNVCEVAEAKVLCCADEAALCRACDEKVHAANKLAGKHQRVPLSSSSSPMPKCDICQETVGYFFCLQDRALLCRKCDVAIHTANTHVSAHQRFLLTGVNVGLESAEPGASSSSGKSQSGDKILETESYSLSRIGTRTPMPLAGQHDKVLPVQVGGLGNVAPSKFPFSGGSDTIPPWQFDDYLGLTGFNENYGSSKILDFFSQAINGKVACAILSMERSKAPTVHSKVTYFVKLDSAILEILDVWADSGKLGESDCSPILRAGEEELEGSEYLGQVPDASWLVPQVPSPPTTSGLHWPKDYRNLSDAPVFVPDICYSPLQNPGHYQPGGNSSKRRRGF